MLLVEGMCTVSIRLRMVVTQPHREGSVTDKRRRDLTASLLCSISVWPATFTVKLDGAN